MFYLRHIEQSDGTTRIEYDAGPADRVQFLTLSTGAQAALIETPDDMIGLTFGEIRPPARTRHRAPRQGEQR